MHKSKALILIDHLGVGGAQEHIFHLCRNLQMDDIHITVCALHSGGKYKGKLEDAGITVEILSPSRKYIYVPVILWRLFRLIQKTDYAIIHTFLHAAFALGTPISRMRSIPTVHTILTAPQASPAWYTFLVRLYYPMLNLLLIPMFKPIPQDYPLLLRKKVRFVPVAIDLKAELAKAENSYKDILPKELNEGDPLVVSIGRLHPDKGHEFAIQAWQHVTREMPAAKLIILGIGKDEERLKNLAYTNGLTKQVLFKSYLEDLAPLFRRADIYLRTSINEGSNLTTMQAMASGIAVIGFRNEAPAETIRHGENGLLVTPRDAQELAQAIIKLGKDKTWRSELGKNARLTIKQVYNLRDVLNYHHKMYTAAARGIPLESIKDLR